MIYCCGEALIDMIPLDLPQGQAFLPVGGGAAWNSAVALGRLGARVGLVAALSQDGFGQRLAAEAEAAGTATDLCPRLPRPSAMALIALSPSGAPEFQIRDAGSAGRMLAADELPAALPGVEAALFGGISLAVSPSAESFEALVGRLPPEALCMIDPNIRPQLIEDAAALRQRLDRLFARADIVKLSSEDLDWLCEDREAFIAGLLASGVALVCETLGGEGLRLYRPGHPVLALPAPRVEVADTVGAGDTFNAGLLAGLQAAGLLTRPALRAASPEALGPALSLALAAAALSVTKPGANPPWRAEVEAFARTAS